MVLVFHTCCVVIYLWVIDLILYGGVILFVWEMIVSLKVILRHVLEGVWEMIEAWIFGSIGLDKGLYI